MQDLLLLTKIQSSTVRYMLKIFCQRMDMILVSKLVNLQRFMFMF